MTDKGNFKHFKTIGYIMVKLNNQNRLKIYRSYEDNFLSRGYLR